MRFGILQRYVMGEVLRAFLLALLTITGIFVLFMVMTEAARKGLTPYDLARLVPFIIPVSLPYTVPVSLLFSVTVVYGRLAADNEVIAVKTAGRSALMLLNPTFALGIFLSIALWYFCQEGIPRANHYAQKIIFSNLEDMFYKVLKKEREFNNPGWPFFIRVRDVEGKVLKGAIFKHRTQGPENPNSFGVTVQAEEATVTFDLDNNTARVFLVQSETQVNGQHPDRVLVNRQLLDIPIPGSSKFMLEPRIQELTIGEMVAKQEKLRGLIENERKRQALAASLWIASGRIGRVDWPHLDAAFRDYQRWEREVNELETEKHMRLALSCGSFFFVLLGAPVGILFARRDFLSAFISCFIPIIVLYYPLTLLGVNMGKEGLVTPSVALWVGNCTLAVLSGLVLPRVMRH